MKIVLSYGKPVFLIILRKAPRELYSRLSLLFSSSNCRSRRNSEGPSPPYFFFQLMGGAMKQIQISNTCGLELFQPNCDLLPAFFDIAIVKVVSRIIAPRQIHIIDR